MGFQVINNKLYERTDYTNRLVTLKEVGKRYLPRSGRLRRALLQDREWKCQECGNEGNLEAHHKEHITYYRNKGYSYQDPKGNHSIENGVLLCKSCHRQKHI